MTALLLDDKFAIVRDFTIVPIEDEAFAVAPEIGLLVHLNGTARIILEQLQSRMSPEQIARNLAVIHSIPAEQILSDIAGLVDNIVEKSAAARRFQAAQPDALPLSKPVSGATYRLFSKTIRVDYPDQNVAASCHPLFAPMGLPENTAPDLTVCFEELDEKYKVTCGIASVMVDRTPMGALGAILRVFLCHDQLDPGLFSVVLHAGAVVGSKGAWLIGGASGSGKSTLVSRFDSMGHTILGDDLIPLDLARSLALPLPMAISVKPQAVPVVTDYRPEIRDIPVCVTGIGKHVRYLAPLNPPQNEDRTGHPVAGLLLPRRKAGALPAIKPVGLKHAMIAMCDEFGRFPIDPEDLANLTSLLADLPRYELVYDDAMQILPELVEML